MKFIFICIQRVLNHSLNDRKCSCVHVGGYCISVSYFSFVIEERSGKQIWNLQVRSFNFLSMIISVWNSYLYASWGWKQCWNDRKCFCVHVGVTASVLVISHLSEKKDLGGKTEIFRLVILTLFFNNFALKFIFICIQRVW